MKRICEDIKNNVADVIDEWEQRVRKEPWFSLPAGHRIDSLPSVVLGIVEASLCRPADVASHRTKVEAACEHGTRRREQGVPEHLILTEYHLLRQAMWYYLVRKFGSSDTITEAIMRIDTAITLATNASMWGYHREEVEALHKWDQAVERIVASSPFLSGSRTG